MSATKGLHSSAGGADPLKKPRTFKGLCCTCIHAADCINAARASLPVVHCEEFDDRVISQLKAAESPFTIKPRLAGNPRHLSKPEPELKGLCLNCDNRKICNHPKPVSGVWYCEEYR